MPQPRRAGDRPTPLHLRQQLAAQHLARLHSATAIGLRHHIAVGRLLVPQRVRHRRPDGLLDAPPVGIVAVGRAEAAGERGAGEAIRRVIAVDRRRRVRAVDVWNWRLIDRSLRAQPLQPIPLYDIECLHQLVAFKTALAFLGIESEEAFQQRQHLLH